MNNIESLPNNVAVLQLRPKHEFLVKANRHMLPKLKDRHFLAAELASIFTTSEKDLAYCIGGVVFK